MRLLVVEDETAMAESLARGLQAEGYGVYVADNGVDGRCSGLGLAIARDLATVHGAPIEISEGDASGAKVRLSFGVVRPPVPTRPLPAVR
jgi:ActR/RegA family two-component response regulator